MSHKLSASPDSTVWRLAERFDEPAAQISNIIQDSRHVLIIQADNPDGDSLGSALALENIIGTMGKQTSLYCGTDMPQYLRYLSGWDRVSPDVPNSFDTSIIVDASTTTLLEKLHASPARQSVAAKPCIVLDHHREVDHIIPYSNAMINDSERSSTGELIFLLARQLGWPLGKETLEYIMTSILGDTQGLSNELASPLTYRLMANMLEAGVNRAELEEKRREYGKMPQVIFRYKAELIKRTEFYGEGDCLAIIVIPQTEINSYSPLYNPAPLIQNDMLQTLGVRVAVVLKTYDDGRITGAIRCNPASGIAAELAKAFGGGGHVFASGFKITDGRPVNVIKSECIKNATDLLNNLKALNGDQQ